MFEADVWRRLFGRKNEAKASATTRVDYLETRGQQAIWTPRDYAELAREGYQNATWVFVCVREIVNAIKSVPLIHYRDNGNAGKRLARTAPALRKRALNQALQRKELEEIDDSPLLKLLDTPNQFTGGGLFKEQAFAYLLLSGNTYVEKVGVRNRPPVELFAKRPDRMRVKPDSKNYVAGYVYRIGQNEVDFKPEQIVHTRTFHPLNDWYGMSVIEAAARGIDMFNTGTAHNVALLQNGARPSGAWVTQNNLEDNQFQRMKAEMHQLADVARRGEPLLLEGGVDWKEMGFSPKDLDWLKGLTDAARQVHAAFGVHPVLTGLQAGTYENQDQALRQLYIRVALPLLELWLSDLNRGLTPVFGEGTFLWYDRDAIPALSEDQDSLWQRATDGWEKGWLKRNEAREMAGYEADEGGDLYITDVNRLGSASPLDNPEPETEGEDDSGNAKAVKAFNLSTEEQKVTLWKARVDRQNRWEGLLEARFSNILDEERQELVHRLEQSNSGDPLTLLPLVIRADRWTEPLNAAGLAIAEDFGEETLAGLPKARAAPLTKQFEGIFGVMFDQVLTFLGARAAESVKQITETTRNQLALTITQGVEAGESIPALAKRVDNLYLEQIIPNRSQVIARTETIRSSNFGSQAAALGTGLNLEKEYVATRDGRTRSSHEAADGQRLPIGSPYVVNGYKMMFPGDPSLGAPAREVVQCRCTEVYHTL